MAITYYVFCTISRKSVTIAASTLLGAYDYEKFPANKHKWNYGKTAGRACFRYWITLHTFGNYIYGYFPHFCFGILSIWRSYNYFFQVETCATLKRYLIATIQRKDYKQNKETLLGRIACVILYITFDTYSSTPPHFTQFELALFINRPILYGIRVYCLSSTPN